MKWEPNQRRIADEKKIEFIERFICHVQVDSSTKLQNDRRTRRKTKKWAFRRKRWTSSEAKRSKWNAELNKRKIRGAHERETESASKRLAGKQQEKRKIEKEENTQFIIIIFILFFWWESNGSRREAERSGKNQAVPLINYLRTNI